MNRLRTLGALGLTDSQGDELRSILAQPKRAALLAYLAVATPRGPHRRDTLTALFWPEADDEHARRALSQAVHFLRRSLGADALISRSDAELGLDRDRVWCDAVAFETALDAGRLVEALDLYRGDLLEGVHIAAAPEFERWLDSERARLAARYAAALEAAAEEHEASGDLAGGVAYWRRLAARDALSSRVALRLMRALAAGGDAAAAIGHARVHETLLREELNLALDPAVVSLVRELQAPRVATPRQQASGAVPASPAADRVIERDAHQGETTPPPTRAGRSPVRLDGWRRPAVMVAVACAAILMFGPRADSVGGEPLIEELMSRGHGAEQNRSPTGIATAKGYYRRALELEPDFAPAYAALSRMYALSALFGYGAARPALDSARMLAVSAAARDAALPEAHTALAMSLGDAGDYRGAEEAFQRAIQLDPGNANAHYWYGILLVALGRAAEARREVELAMKHDPLSPPRGVMSMRRNTTYIETGKRPPAQWESINVLEPGEPWARRGHALDLALHGECSDARAKIEIAERLAPDVIQMIFATALIARFCGEPGRAQEIMARMKAHPRAFDDGMWIAMTHAPFGELDSAFAWLDHQVWTTLELTDLRANRWLDSLRTHPRYAELLEGLGLRPPKP